MRTVKTHATVVCDIRVDSVNKWGRIQLRHHVDYSGGGGPTQDKPYDSVLNIFKWLQGCLGQLTECRGKIVDD